MWPPDVWSFEAKGRSLNVGGGGGVRCQAEAEEAEVELEIGFDAGFHVVNQGAGEMRINGKVTTAGVVKVGGTVEIRGSRGSKLLLYCTERPTHLRMRYLTSGAREG